jgi:hypothetical protein
VRLPVDAGGEPLAVEHHFARDLGPAILGAAKRPVAQPPEQQHGRDDPERADSEVSTQVAIGRGACRD